VNSSTGSLKYKWCIYSLLSVTQPVLEKAKNLGQFFFSVIQVSERKNVNILKIMLEEVKFSQLQFTLNLLILELWEYNL